MRTIFQKHLDSLEQDLFTMADKVIDAIRKSVLALKNQDLNEAKRIIDNDILINNKRWEIEETCIKLIATQQPVASDLRELIAILNIITDLERMGDYAEGIARIVLKLGNSTPVKALIDIPRMEDIAIEMIQKSLRAYAERDDLKARAISTQDDEIDQLYNQIQRELISIMIEDPSKITRSTYLLWASHNLERIGDRVTNICERIIYLVTGEMIENISRESE
ncbi:MAG: phosphate signaling complex protein PhoU [Balneolaceae bacterium]